MKLSQEQINKISSAIMLKDIKEYINTHAKEYEEFIKNSKSNI